MTKTTQGATVNKVNDATEKPTTALAVVKKDQPTFSQVETAAERIERNEKFTLLGERFKFLQGKRKEVDHFLTAADGTSSAKIMVTNSNGASLEISNGAVITDLLKTATKTLDSMIEETELEILSFKI